MRALTSNFSGTSGVAALVRCLVQALDQTERLPVNIFEQIPRRPPTRSTRRSMGRNKIFQYDYCIVNDY